MNAGDLPQLVSPPGKFTDSPTITLGMPNWITAPVQRKQGISVL